MEDYTYQELSATGTEWETEGDRVRGLGLGLATGTLVRQNVHCVQVQRWDSGILVDGNDKAILVAMFWIRSKRCISDCVDIF